MISVVVPTANSERLLPRCFDSLIAGAVRGIVREVIVTDAGSSDSTLAIADAAGAHVVHSRKNRGAQLADGAATAKGDWLLFLYPETALEPGWEMEAESFISQAEMERPRAAAFRFALDDFGGEARRAEAKAALRTALFALPYGDQGLLIPKRLYKKLGGYRALADLEDADLVRRIGRRRLVSLRARAINVARPHKSALRGLALTVLHTLRVPSRLLANL
ncbi:MAG TPA: glycosyltransferase [Rhizomicrobium sp.]|nr:glycosyltransferase [Rhizomicrobium sp.]